MDVVSIDRLGDEISVLRLNDAEHQNRLTADLCSQWIAALDTLAGDGSLRTLIVAGRADVFCAGASRQELRKLSAKEIRVQDLSLPDRLLAFPLPVVAALEGHAVGGGLMLALCCDIVVAASNRRYGLNFAALGFTPGMGAMQMVPALVGHHVAAEMLLSGRFFRGDELALRGMFNAVAPSDEVFAVALDRARQIADKPRHVLEMIKSTLSLPRRRMLADSMSREHLMHEICFSRAETAELVEQSYLETEGP